MAAWGPTASTAIAAGIVSPEYNTTAVRPLPATVAFMCRIGDTQSIELNYLREWDNLVY